jgi:putative ABC transport system permease protein
MPEHPVRLAAGASAVLRLAEWLVPPMQRAGWRREWHAELRAAHARGRSQFRLALGALADARALRSMQRTSGVQRSGSDGEMRADEIAGALRRAARTLVRSPGFTLTSVMTLALGIAATAAIFTLVDAILIRPLPYPSAPRLVRLYHTMTEQGAGTRENPLTHHTFLFIREQSRTIEAAGAYRGGQVALTGDGEAERVAGVRATTGLLQVLGARTVLGRYYTEEEDRPGAAPVVVLGHGLWQRRYGADPGVLGRTIVVDGTLREVIGVMAEDVHLPTSEVALWIPEAIDATRSPSDEFRLQAIGRVAAGHDIAAVREELGRLTTRLPELAPFFTIYIDQFGLGMSATPLRDYVVGDIASTLWILLGSVGIVLLVALANVANLFLVRAEGRRQEVAVRSALGARPAHLLGHFMSESLLIASFAATIGLLIAAAAVRILIAMAPPSIPRLDELQVGSATIAFVLLLCVVVTIALGSYPYLRFGRSGAQALNPRGVRGAADPRQALTGDILVAAQVALALMLLAGAALLLRSFQNLRSIDPGFRAEGVIVANLVLPPATYTSDAAVLGFLDRMDERLRAIPGVRRTAVGASPLALAGGCSGLYRDDYEPPPGTFPPCAGMARIGAGYFETLGIPIVAGRTFTEADIRDGAAVAVVTESLAKRLWPDANPIGRGVRPAPRSGPPWYRVIGVVGDVRAAGPAEPPSETVFLPVVMAHDPWGPMRAMTILAAVDPATGTALAPALRTAITSIDADVPVDIDGTLAEAVARTMVRTTFTLFLLGSAAIMALVLGLVGLYGVVAYRVGARRSEFGIRMAIGALRSDVLSLVLGHSLRLVAIGSVIGIIGAFFGTRVLGTLLHGVRPGEPWLLAASTAALFLAAFAAAWIPARRATRVDPASTLRTD